PCGACDTAPLPTVPGSNECERGYDSGVGARDRGARLYRGEGRRAVRAPLARLRLSTPSCMAIPYSTLRRSSIAIAQRGIRPDPSLAVCSAIAIARLGTERR